jgi:hypothetical protein
MLGSRLCLSTTFELFSYLNVKRKGCMAVVALLDCAYMPSCVTVHCYITHLMISAFHPAGTRPLVIMTASHLEITSSCSVTPIHFAIPGETVAVFARGLSSRENFHVNLPNGIFTPRCQLDSPRNFSVCDLNRPTQRSLERAIEITNVASGIPHNGRRS